MTGPRPGETWQLLFGRIVGIGKAAIVAPEPFGSGRRLLYILAVGGKWVTAANPVTLQVGQVHVRDWPKHRPRRIDDNRARGLRRLKEQRAALNRQGVPIAAKTLRGHLARIERGLK